MPDVGCPKCAAAVQPDWDWCHRCGFDPEGKKPPGWTNDSGAGTGVVPPVASGGAAWQPPDSSAPGRERAPGLPQQSGAWGAPPGIPPGYAVPPGYGAPQQQSNTGKIVAIAVTVVLLVGCLPITAIFAVTFLGRQASSKFSSVGSAIYDDRAAPPPAKKTWTKTASDDGKYSFEMPGKPKKNVQTSSPVPGTSITVTTYSFETSDATFLVGSYELPPGTSFLGDPGEALQLEATAIAEGLGGTKTSVDSSAFAGNPARQVSFRLSGATGRCMSFVAAGSRVTDACAMGRPTLDEDDYKKLLASIQLR